MRKTQWQYRVSSVNSLTPGMLTEFCLVLRKNPQAFPEKARDWILILCPRVEKSGK